MLKFLWIWITKSIQGVRLLVLVYVVSHVVQCHRSPQSLVRWNVVGKEADSDCEVMRGLWWLSKCFSFALLHSSPHFNTRGGLTVKTNHCRSYVCALCQFVVNKSQRGLVWLKFTLLFFKRHLNKKSWQRLKNRIKCGWNTFVLHYYTYTGSIQISVCFV